MGLGRCHKHVRGYTSQRRRDVVSGDVPPTGTEARLMSRYTLSFALLDGERDFGRRWFGWWLGCGQWCACWHGYKLVTAIVLVRRVTVVVRDSYEGPMSVFLGTDVDSGGIAGAEVDDDNRQTELVL